MRRLVPALLALLLSLPALAADPCSSPLEASFAHELRDGRHLTTKGLVVPAPLAEVEAVLTDFASYPRWLFTGPGGAPTLHDVTWNRDAGTFTLFIGAGGKGMPLSGKLAVTKGEASTSLRASGSDEDLKEWSFELTAKPDAACAQRTMLTLRIDIVFSLKARVFGGSGKSMPLLLALAARDDLASLFVTTPERLKALLASETIATLPSGRPAISLEGKEPAEIHSCRPHSLSVGAARAEAFGKVLQRVESGKKVELAELLDATTAAITGRHVIASWQLDVAGRENRTVLGKAPASVWVGAEVKPEEKGFSLGFGAGASE